VHLVAQFGKCETGVAVGVFADEFRQDLGEGVGLAGSLAAAMND
jgi:hypothetical protein